MAKKKNGKKIFVISLISIFLIASVSGIVIFVSALTKHYPPFPNPPNDYDDIDDDIGDPIIPPSGGGGGSSDPPIPDDVPDPPVEPPPSNVNFLEGEETFYRTYLTSFVKESGAITSNIVPVGWCPNSCIGCDEDISSEAVARLALYATLSNDKETLDREVDFYYDIMAHPSTGHMMWKLNSDGSVGACGGQNSAIDSELIFIEALLKADRKWSSDSEGRTYRATAIKVMNSMKSGIINSNGKKYLPFCMYVQGNETRPCTNKVFLGYMNINALKEMCLVDSFWCQVKEDTVNLMLGSIQDGGTYSAYDSNTGTYLWENADIHSNWVIKHLVEGGYFDSVDKFYNEGRNVFYTENRKICQEFKPRSGCKVTNPPMRVYGHYLEIASAINDEEFKQDLIEIINEKRLEDGSILSANDNYGNIVILEAYADARQ